MLKIKGPLLIASNHPNSFLDAIIYDILFDIPITSLARGDAFKWKRIFYLLRALKMLPVYRIREGAENLNTNYETFDTCSKIFKKEEAILIFSEGLCINEWHLRPLKKGTARLSLKAWNEEIPLQVLPAGINYSSFRRYGKKIHIHFGDLINSSIYDSRQSDGYNHSTFNTLLQSQLQKLVYEIPNNNCSLLREKFGKSSLQSKILCAPFALIGALLHLPLYGLARLIVKIFFSKTDHFDSVMFAILLLTYPLYITIITLIAYHIFSIYGILAIILLPFVARCFVKYDIRLDH